MNNFYLKHMAIAHENKQWIERRNYAKAAGVDLIKWFYLSE